MSQESVYKAFNDDIGCRLAHSSQHIPIQDSSHTVLWRHFVHRFLVLSAASANEPFEPVTRIKPMSGLLVSLNTIPDVAFL